MKLRAFSLLVLILSLTGINPANAAETRVVTGVSAFYRVDLGYMVGWTLPASREKIAGYTVTATPGNFQCVARGANSNRCTFTNKQLGYKEIYAFTVVVNSAEGNGPVSAPSNSIRHASIPFAPQIPMAKVVSDTAIDIAWVPDINDGGAPLYGYKVNVWESQANGDPGAVAHNSVALKPNISVTGLKPSTLYIINVASCNVHGCNSADKWTYISTTGPTGVSTIRPPRVLSGGSATTTCWNRTLDAGNASSTGVTITRNSYACTAPFVDPALYPKIDPTATTLNPVPLATKFSQSVSFFGWAKTYSMKEWSRSGGNGWFAYFFASSKHPTLGFTIEPTIVSKSPTTCSVNGRMIRFLAPGECLLEGSVGGDNVWLPSGVATSKFTITP
jgi:hypothetical protein